MPARTCASPRPAAALPNQPRVAIPPLPGLFHPRTARRWVRAYCYGDCHQFTAALTEALGRPAAVEYVLRGEGALHSAVRLADGRTLDASGFVTVSRMRERCDCPQLRAAPCDATRARRRCIDGEEMAQALEVAARLRTIPLTIRKTCWRHRWTAYAGVEELWCGPVTRGPIALD